MRNHNALTTHLHQFESEHTTALIDYIGRYAPRWSADYLRAQLQRTHDALSKQLADENTPCRDVNTAQVAVLDETFTWLDGQQAQIEAMPQLETALIASIERV